MQFSLRMRKNCKYLQEDLKSYEKISQYLNQLNEKPVLFTWRYKMDEMDEMPGGITI